MALCTSHQAMCVRFVQIVNTNIQGQIIYKGIQTWPEFAACETNAITTGMCVYITPTRIKTTLNSAMCLPSVLKVVAADAGGV